MGERTTNRESVPEGSSFDDVPSSPLEDPHRCGLLELLARWMGAAAAWIEPGSNSPLNYWGHAHSPQKAAPAAESIASGHASGEAGFVSLRTSAQRVVPLRSLESEPRRRLVLEFPDSRAAEIADQEVLLLSGRITATALECGLLGQARKVGRAIAPESGPSEGLCSLGESEGVAVSAIDGTIHVANEAFWVFHGCNLERRRSRNLLEFVVPREMDGLAQAMKRCVEGKERSYRRETSLPGQDGNVRLVEETSFLVRDGEGAPIHFVTHLQDVTERKRSEEVLLRAYAEMERQMTERTEALVKANTDLRNEIEERHRVERALRRSEEHLRFSQKMEAIGRLAGEIAHEFNNLLTIILGNAELVQRRLPNDIGQSDEFAQIVAAADRAANLTRKMTAFSRTQVLSPKVFEINKLITDMERMLRYLAQDHIELVLDLDPQAGCISADPSQLDMVILNLVNNSRDAMPSGGQVRICTDVQTVENAEAGREGVAAGRYVVIEVADDGVGIAPEVLPHIFDPFFTTKDIGKGTGLGLSTVYGIVKQSGGFIRVRSAVSKGTTFNVFLPRVESAPETLSERRYRTTPPPRKSVDPATILLVEDEPLVADYIATALGSAHFRVLHARSQEESIRQLLQHPGSVQLLITDLELPSGSGLDLARRLCLRQKNLPLLFVSGHDEPPAVRQVFPNAVYLQKPFSPDLLIEMVRRLIEASEGTKAAEV